MCTYVCTYVTVGQVSVTVLCQSYMHLTSMPTAAGTDALTGTDWHRLAVSNLPSIMVPIPALQECVRHCLRVTWSNLSR